MTIFVSVAAYRDPELVPTVLDCLATAERPDELRIVICWQHGPGEDIPELCGDDRIEIIDVDWRDSRGACWARSEIFQRYAGEQYLLQLDSHHRFAPGWDTGLVAMATAAGPKAIITGYPPGYVPGEPVPIAAEPTQIVFTEFMEENLPLYRQETIPDWRLLDRPVRARFLAAGFLFAPGSFVEDVPYDPDLYFHGEEITLSVRAFTHGYDLFHPTEVLLWHQYLRVEQPKHWTDHDQPAVADDAWWRRDRRSRRRAGNLLRCPSLGPLACGPVRTVAEYEAYAGLDFRNATATADALAGVEPLPSSEDLCVIGRASS